MFIVRKTDEQSMGNASKTKLAASLFLYTQLVIVIACQASKSSKEDSNKTPSLKTQSSEYFCTSGRCEIKMLSCPSEFVSILKSGSDYGVVSSSKNDELTHQECLDYAVKVHNRCGIKTKTKVSFYSSSGADNKYVNHSETIIFGEESSGNSQFRCEYSFKSCENGEKEGSVFIGSANYLSAKALCLEHLGEKVKSCGKGSLVSFGLSNSTSDNGMSLYQYNASPDAFEFLNTCSADDYQDIYVDYSLADEDQSLIIGDTVNRRLAFAPDLNIVSSASGESYKRKASFAFMNHSHDKKLLSYRIHLKNLNHLLSFDKAHKLKINSTTIKSTIFEGNFSKKDVAFCIPSAKDGGPHQFSIQFVSKN